MGILLNLLYVIEFFVAALLILVILVQRSKAGGGLGGLATTSSGAEEAFGADAGNVLVKVTVYLAIIFGINTITIGVMQGVVNNRKTIDVSPIAQNAEADTSEEPVADEKAAPKVEVKPAAPKVEVKPAAPKVEVKPAAPKVEVKPAAPKVEVKPAAKTEPTADDKKAE